MGGKRWILKEEEALAEFRHCLKDQLEKYPYHYPDVIGDRKLLRFLRGKQYDINEAAKLYRGFLNWRIENKIDDIRNQILYGGIDTPLKFPFAKILLELAPQIVISAKATDRKGRPLVLEQYSFNPNDVFTAVTTEEYLLFMMYTLEYRALVMEQMSHEAEERYLALHPDPSSRVDGYGVVLLNYCIRDLQGVGMSHLTGKGKALIEAAMHVGIPNYPEYLGKCCMINAPWIFNSAWYFIKAFLDEITLAKISICGSKFIDILKSDMDIESIPRKYGGEFDGYHESYEFDTSPSGAFYSNDAMILPVQQIASSITTTSSGVTDIDKTKKKLSITNNNNKRSSVSFKETISSISNSSNNKQKKGKNVSTISTTTTASSVSESRGGGSQRSNSLIEDCMKSYEKLESILAAYPVYSAGILIMFAIFPTIMYRYVFIPFLLFGYISYVDNKIIK